VWFMEWAAAKERKISTAHFSLRTYVKIKWIVNSSDWTRDNDANSPVVMTKHVWNARSVKWACALIRTKFVSDYFTWISHLGALNCKSSRLICLRKCNSVKVWIISNIHIWQFLIN
jgi:hypothetical protein